MRSLVRASVPCKLQHIWHSVASEPMHAVVVSSYRHYPARAGSNAFTGEAALVTNQGAAAGVRVARLQLPSGTHVTSHKAKQAVVPVTLDRVRLARVQQALTV